MVEHYNQPPPSPALPVHYVLCTCAEYDEQEGVRQEFEAGRRQEERQEEPQPRACHPQENQ